MKPFKWGAALAVLATLGGGSAMYALASKLHSDFPITPAFAIAATIATLAATPFFLIGLKRFKAGLRRAYVTLCIGIALFGLAQAQLPVITLSGWWFWVDTGGVALPYLAAVVLILIGMRQFAGLLSIKSRATSLVFATVTALVAAVMVSFLPHVATGEDELLYDISNGLVTWDIVFISFAAAAAWLIRRRIGRVYVPAMWWLTLAFASIAVAGAHHVAMYLLVTEGNWYFDNSFNLVPFIISGLLFVKAGYEFNKIGRAESTIAEDATLVEVIVYVADLASDPQAINPMLDRLRQVTANLSKGQPLNEHNRQALAGVYFQLEDYLITRESLREFTKSSLRQEVQHRFTLDPAAAAILVDH